MAQGQVIQHDRLISAFIYEGERIAVQYPDGCISEIVPSRIYMALTKGFLPSGEPCHILSKLSPLTRLPIVVLNNKTGEIQL